MIREEITTGQIYRVQVDFEDLRDSYVRVLRVNPKNQTVNLVRVKSNAFSHHVVPFWVIENSVFIFRARRAEPESPSLARSKNIWQRIMELVKS